MTKVRRYIIGTLMLVLSVAAIAQGDEPTFPELEKDPAYAELKRKNNELLNQEDSLQNLIDVARDRFRAERDSVMLDRNFMENFSTYIIDLEQRIFELRQERADIITQINIAEQLYILEHMYTVHDNEDDAFSDDVNALETTPTRHRELTKNEIFTELLAEVDYNELLVSQAEDVSMEDIAKEYIETYRKMSSTVASYNAASDEDEADGHYSRYLILRDKADSLNREIDRRWNHVLDTKYFAYGTILEKRLRYDLLDSSSADFSTMLQQCAENDGIYASDALMHYAIGRPTLLGYEMEFASEMELTEALDSLRDVRENLYIPDFHLNPISVERRLFLDYAPITIGRTNFYNVSNPIPELRVFERGTIYRILLGSFRNKQPLTLFKGVQPLYITKEENGFYSYYTGGFETLREAEEAALFLKEKGFKRPEVCRWKDGEMVNLSTEDKDDEGDDEVGVIPAGHRYIVLIECEDISEELNATIKTTASDKRISRMGDKFAVGTFTARSDADLLISAIMENHPEVTVSIKELDL